MQSCDRVAKCPKAQLTLCHHITPKDVRVTTLYTLWTTPSVTIARNSYAHACIHLLMPTVLKAEI